MTLLDRLERRFGQWAIPGLIRYVVALNAVVFLLIRLKLESPTHFTFNSALIMQGEVWRLISWTFIPNTLSPIFIFFFLYFTWFISDSLEATWGSFRLNVYYVLGVVGGIAAAFLTGSGGSNVILLLSLLLAVATLAPNLEVLLLVFPVKLKWVAAISLIQVVLTLISGTIADRIAILLCFANYLLFFGPTFLRNMRNQRTVIARRAKFESAKDTTPYLHKCETCGKTELTDPDAEFRVTEDGREYCTPHLPKAIAGASLKNSPPASR
ncbi:hypothetical protein BH09VER1_BH09VER1_11540 [soil metagenome]